VTYQVLFLSDISVCRLFWKAAYAETQEKFESCIVALYEQKEIAAEYVLSIPHEHWATYAMQGRRYGHCTSNLAEIANSVLRSFRELPLLEMLNSLYRHQMEKFHKRKQDSIKWVSPLVPTAMDRFNTELTNARMMSVCPASADSGVVIDSSGQQFVVELPTSERTFGSCSCRFFQNFLMPCRHACSFAIKVQIAPISLVAEYYTVSNYRQTYEQCYLPLTMTNLECIEMMPPQVARPRGRPATKRKEKGCQPSQALECGRLCKSCGQSGHNRRTCREAHS
jgi:hypothetical protein